MLQRLKDWLLKRPGQAEPKQADLTETEVHRLVGLCEGILADDQVTQREAEFLQDWVSRDMRYRDDRRTRPVVSAVYRVLSDYELNQDEAEELRTELSEFCDRMLDAEKEAQRKEEEARQAEELKKHREEQRRKEREAKEGKRAPAEVATKASKKSSSSSVPPPVPGDVFDISYADANGSASDREIEFKSASNKKGHTYLNAYCLTRNAFRTFRADRIDFCFHTGVGRSVSDPETYFL